MIRPDTNQVSLGIFRNGRARIAVASGTTTTTAHTPKIGTEAYGRWRSNGKNRTHAFVELWS